MRTKLKKKRPGFKSNDFFKDICQWMWFGYKTEEEEVKTCQTAVLNSEVGGVVENYES